MDKEQHLLLIDDNELFCSMMKASLEKEGWLVDTALNGSEGLDKCRHKDYALVITDLIMPEKEGLETIQTLRSLKPELPILCVSGGGLLHPGNILDIAVHLGANEAYSKPVKRDVIINAVKRLINKEL